MENRLTEDQIIQLKDKYWNLYQSEILGHKFIWRELSRGEYSRIIRLFPNDYDREEEVCKVCVVEPVDFDFRNCSAGIPSSLAVQILAESGFGEGSNGKINSILNRYREEMNSFQHQISCIIHEAFPTIDMEEIENWPQEKTLWYYSRAEWKINNLRGMVPLENGGQDPDGGTGDFPELAKERAFMEGKLR